MYMGTGVVAEYRSTAEVQGYNVYRGTGVLQGYRKSTAAELYTGTTIIQFCSVTRVVQCYNWSRISTSLQEKYRGIAVQ
jgi:hypothetical protein